MTIPAFFLEPRSLLERWADVLMHPELLHGVSALPDPLARLKAITRWYLSGWHYKTVGVKKPFNPIVGETFACAWPHADGSRTQYFAEQVSHRPPISAIYFENAAHHISCNAHVWTKGQFQAPQTTKSILDGACSALRREAGSRARAARHAAHRADPNRPSRPSPSPAVLRLTNLDEEYYITFPTFNCHNLLIGTMRLEVGDSARIVCKRTGLSATLDFHQLTMFSAADRLNSVAVKLVRDGGKGGEEVLVKLHGHWDKQIFETLPTGEEEVRAGRGGGRGAHAGAHDPILPPPPFPAQLFLDIASLPVAAKHVLPVSEQGPWESRRLWQHTTAALGTRPAVDWMAVEREKGQLEEEQRLLACHARAGSAEFRAWPTKCFATRAVRDETTGATRELFAFTGAPAAGAPPLDVLALSRDLPDERGGRGGAGAVADVVAATRGVKLSAARAKDWA